MTLPPQIIESEDGSHTLISPVFNASYHSTKGAITESKVVFINAGLEYFKSTEDKIAIFEMGFGTGLNAFLSCLWAVENQKELIYHTIEAYPINVELAQKLNYGSLGGNDSLFQCLHTCPWETEQKIVPNFSFNKHQGFIENLETFCTYDVIYFDAFAPDDQPTLWEESMLKKMYNLLNHNGILVSYCAKGSFKRTLKDVGFRIENLPGPPGKREITRAIKGDK